MNDGVRRAGRASIGFCLLGLAAVLCWSGCSASRGDEPDSDAKKDPVPVELAIAEVRPVEVTVSGQGTLMPAQGASARIAPTIAGRLHSVLVKEGDRVTAGQIVALLDVQSLQAQAHSAAAALNVAQMQASEGDVSAAAAAQDQTSAVKAARLALDAARLDRSNTAAAAQTEVLQAQTDLTRVRAGARPQEIKQAEQAVAQDVATWQRARIERDRVARLRQIGVASAQQADDAATSLQVAEAAVESARAQESLVRAGARPEEVRAAELRVQHAQQALDAARTEGDARVAQARAALSAAQKDILTVTARRREAQALRDAVAQKRADLAAAEASASYAVVRSPISGVITHRAMNAGDMADPAAPILDVSNIRALDLSANLAASDGQRVQAGMPAHVTAPDEPDHSYLGAVQSVGQIDPQTNLMPVRIRIPNEGSRLRVGQFAVANIVVRVDTRAVTVPRQAVINNEQGSAVFIVDADDAAHQKDVKVGVESGGDVEIVSGVKKGDRVVRLGDYELTDGAKVKPATDGDAHK